MLTVQNNNQPTATIIDPRGLRVTAAAHLMSGFTVYTGEREIGSIRVEEGIAQGIGVTYLSSLRIVNVAGNQILWEDSFRDVMYNRERVRQIISKELIGIIKKALRNQRQQASIEEITAHVDQILNKAYYEQTDKTVLKILTEWGIEVKPA
jgi:hypothetical protein